MDPNETLYRFTLAIDTESPTLASEYYEYLRDWLELRGSEPKWEGELHGRKLVSRQEFFAFDVRTKTIPGRK